MMKVAKGKARRRQEAATPGGKRRPTADLSQLDEESQVLYQELCELRTQLATEQQVPPYIIFSNATLVDMCAKRPRNIDEFLDVSGVGAKKAQAYGNLFLARLNP